MMPSKERSLTMGREYYGDIEGKFWFALQSSSAPERFGAIVELSYSLDENDIDVVKEELEDICKKTPLTKIDKFFENRTSYNDEMLEEAGITRDQLSEYADYKLGKQILDCLEKTGQCNFWGQI